MPKILVLDIETRPSVGYFWRAFDENIGYEQVIDNGGMICFAAKWVGEKEVYFYSDWTHTHNEMVGAAYDLLCEADAVVTFAGDRFDLPKLNGEFILEGFDAPPPPTSIDVLKTVKKFGFVINKLAYIGPLLQIGAKVKHEGFGLWKSVLDGDVKAQAKMRKYNIQDVVLTEKLYKKVRPFIRNHPNMNDQKPGACGACGSVHIQKRGVRRTKMFLVQRLQCQNCGSWFEGTRKKA